MSIVRKAIVGALLAFLATNLFPRIPFLYIFIFNTPSRLKSLNTFPQWTLKLTNTVRNCEDAIIDEDSGTLILSCDPGRDTWNTVMGNFVSPDAAMGALWYYKYSKYGFDKEGEAHPLTIEGMDGSQWIDMHPLGLGYHAPSRRLIMVNHHASGPSLEIFKLSKDATSLKYEQTIRDSELLKTPNSIVALDQDEWYISNDHGWEIRSAKFMAQLETYSAYPGGSVVYINLSTGERKKVANIAFANGVAVLKNGTELAVASTTTPFIRVYEIDDETRHLTQKRQFTTWFLPDNLKVDSNGRLLVAGHPHPDPVGEQAARNHLYDLDGPGRARSSENERKLLLPEKERPRSASWVAEWDGTEEGGLVDVYVGGDIDAGTTAIRDARRGVGFVTGLYGKGVLAWKE